MDEILLPKLAAWVTDAGLAGVNETSLLAGFCERAILAGVPLARASVLIDTLHPIHEGRVFLWERDKEDIASRDYGRTGGTATTTVGAGVRSIDYWEPVIRTCAVG